MREPPRNFKPEPYAYHEELKLQIEDLTNLGQGVARDNGWVVFIPYALPGERVRVRVWRNKKTYSEADLIEVLEPSGNRIEPVCPLFDRCGGCQYQHYAYPAQLEWKRNQIEQLLRKMAGLEVTVNPCMGSPEHIYGYRSKITPHFRRPPHLPDTPIGFQKASTRAIVDVDHCPIASPAINVALPRERRRLQEEAGRFRRGGTLLLRDCEEGVLTDMKAIGTERVGAFVFQFVAGEFFQNNPHVLPDMVRYAVRQAAAPGMEFLVDAYCGVGVFGICAHRDFTRVTGIEVSERAIGLARENARINKVDNGVFHQGKAERIFGDIPFPAAKTTVLLDPPRKGCDPDFIRQLVAYGPARIVYVSCGPDTQARDLGLLAADAYTVVDVQPVDLFPHTRHIENIATLERRA